MREAKATLKFRLDPVGARGSKPADVRESRGERYGALVTVATLLSAFFVLESCLRLGTAIQIGADEGFNLAKATLCLKGYRLYTDVWCDQPPLHTFLVTQLLKHAGVSVLAPRLMTVGCAAALLVSVFLLALRFSGLRTAAVASTLTLAAPGFLGLSSSCMLEIPALAMGACALCTLAVVRDGKWCLREALSGVLFGVALQIKPSPALLLPLAGLVIWLPAFNGATRARSALWRPPVFGAALLAAWLAIEFAVDGGAYLTHFGQSWGAHFAAPRSLEYGGPSDHPFPADTLVRNWDAALPACVGLYAILGRPWKERAGLLPLGWLALALGFFACHRPWWPYYYIHIAIPLCWCGAVGIEYAWARIRQARRLVPCVLFTAYMISALAWAGARLYVQVSNIRGSPQTYDSPVLAEIERFKPLTGWMYADDTVFSFHAGIPLPPQLAVVSLKRMWSGDMTNARIASEVEAFRPGLILLRNDGRAVPFQRLLEVEYRLVYLDDRHRLYAHQTISRGSNQPPK